MDRAHLYLVKQYDAPDLFLYSDITFCSGVPGCTGSGGNGLADAFVARNRPGN